MQNQHKYNASPIHVHQPCTSLQSRNSRHIVDLRRLDSPPCRRTPRPPSAPTGLSSQPSNTPPARSVQAPAKMERGLSAWLPHSVLRACGHATLLREQTLMPCADDRQTKGRPPSTIDVDGGPVRCRENSRIISLTGSYLAAGMPSIGRWYLPLGRSFAPQIVAKAVPRAHQSLTWGARVAKTL